MKKINRTNKIQILLSIVFLGIIISCMPSDKEPKNNGDNFGFKVETLASGLESPWGLEFLPDGRILIVEKPGRLRIWENGVLIPEAIGGLPAVWPHGQGGLLDVKMHPDYLQNGWLYFAYSSPGPGGGNTAIGRGKLEDKRITNFEVIFQGQPYSSGAVHFGTRIVFDAQNYLYTTIGDRGEMPNAQNLGNHNGKVLRLFDDGRVPQDNPFVGVEGAMPEIWSYGHRNIQGMVFNRASGDLWTHEHGPKGGDEINIVIKGANYGWPLATFGVNYSGTIISNNTSLPGMRDPVLQWTPSIAPCGLEMITSDKFPNWKGNLLVGALAGQHIQRVVLDGQVVVHTEKLLQDFARFRAVKQGPDNLIYALTESPGLFIRLVPEK